MQLDFMPKEARTAEFSEDRQYRYTLRIVWDPSLPIVQWIGLNPSTADEVRDDPTIRRCKAFARAWGYGGIIMTNLFAFRATLPKDMLRHPAPIGQEIEPNIFTEAGNGFLNRNDFWLSYAKARCPITVAAWGKDGSHLNRGAAVAKLITGMKCLGTNGDGSPKHPLYLSKDTELIDFTP